MMIGRTLAFATVLISGASSADADGAAQHVWPGDVTSRLEVLAALQSLQIDLLTRDSATLTLDDWCARHHIDAPGSKIVAERDEAVAKPASAEQRRLLDVSPDEPIRYRRVRLKCGTHVLSEADNWYVPSRLTPQMNAELDSSNAAFGRVVQALRFRRQTLSAKLLWSPLPSGWDSDTATVIGATTLQIPLHVIENRALLVTANGAPFSEVVESYTSEVLDFTAPSHSD
jgi:chorismate-pyruvate lyase